MQLTRAHLAVFRIRAGPARELAQNIEALSGSALLCRVYHLRQIISCPI